MESSSFYTYLHSFEDFAEVSNSEKYRALPDDWIVVVADIRDSTTAVNNGQLKAVNIIGVAVITSIRNAVAPVQIPYIFGGDGASLCIPPQARRATQQALIATQSLALKQFDLKLRIGMVAVADIKAANFQLSVAKHQWAERVCQAAFFGGGMEYAEFLLKSDSLPAFDQGLEHKADYGGLECRWNQVASRHGETIALIVRQPSSLPPT